MDRSPETPVVYRPYRILAIGMAGAAMFWGAALYYLLGFDGVPWRTLVTAFAFTIFFVCGLLYYGRTAIFVDEGGITYRGMLRTRSVTWDEIRGISILPGPLTVYSVRCPGFFVHFTSFFAKHRALAQLLMENARNAVEA